MARTKAERITDIEQQIVQLENQRKRLMQQQKEEARKERSRRLYHRMGLFESLLPDSINLTDEQYQEFLTQTILSNQARHLLTKLLTQNAEATPTISSETVTATDADEDAQEEWLADEGEADTALQFGSTPFARRP